MELKSEWFVFLLFYIHSVCSENSNEIVRGCSVTSNTKGSARNNLTLEEFYHNNRKGNEFFRISLIFPWKRPVIGILSTNSSLNYYFGDVGDNRFAIYGNHQDWIYRRKPCDSVKSEIFESNPFVEMDIVLSKNGRFSVFAYGQEGFVLSCVAPANLTDEISFDIGYAGESKQKLYYDCPNKC
ncbi:hypothetical protein ACFFRR_002154 [Megaselia abdita]